MIISKKISLLAPLVLILGLVALAYGNIVFLGRSLNPVLLIPDNEIKLSTGYADITGNTGGRHGWHVDLANPAYLEWPVNLFIGQALKAGYIPLVMPYQNLGIPLAGQYCHRIFSPYQLIENLFLPNGYDFFILLRLVLAGVFTYLFLRPLCRARVSALLGAVGCGLGSVMVIYSNHEEVSNVAMTIPLLMWAVRAFFDRPGLVRICWLALALALVHTSGQPEIQLYVLLLALVYGLARLFTLPKGRKAGVFFSSLGAIGLSGLIAAPQIILFILFHEEAWTYHPPGGNLGLQTPIAAANFFFSFFPRLRQIPWPWSYRTVNLLWDWVGGYFGLSLLLLAGAAARRNRQNRREVLVFGLYFLFILAKNLGWSPAQLLGLLPLFDQTWSPRWAAPTWSFALAVLAALGLDKLLFPAFAGEPFRPAAGTTPRGRAADILGNPLLTSGLLLAIIALAAVFRWQSAEMWQIKQLRSYVFFNGLLVVSLAAGVFLLWHLLPAGLRKYLSGARQALRRGSGRSQFEIIGLLAATAAAAMAWSPERHYWFPLPEPAGSYLLATPILLAALAGIFFIAASPAGIGTAAAAAAAIPLSLAAGLTELPSGPLPAAWWIVFVLGLTAVFFPPKSRLRKILPPVFSSLLLGGLAAAFFFGEIFSARADRMLRWHLLFACLILFFFSWLALRARKGGGGSWGWLFLFPVWAELAVYIPRNHFGGLLLNGYIPFLATAVLVIPAVFFGRFFSPPRKLFALAAAGLAGGATAFLLLDAVSAPRLPGRSTPGEPLPFVRFLQERQPHALTGVGRVLAPNFASAHGLVDMRGCVSMNTRDYQFLLEDIIRIVPPNSSYSLWYTGDNPVVHQRSSPYGSARVDHIRAFERGFAFFRLAGARYIVSPPGVLDRSRKFPERPMFKVYANEADIWEIPALPPAFLAHRAGVVSMREDPRRWARAIVEVDEVLDGELVLLEKSPQDPLPPGQPSDRDRAELITGEDPNRFTVRFCSETPAYLVVNRIHTNLLRASLEGRSIPILPANGPFFAVPVPGGQGERVIEFSYLPTPVRWSYRIALAGLAATLAGLLAGGIYRRKESLQDSKG